MTAQNLPIYKIKDFEPRSAKENFFYLNRFNRHLRKHQFIQKPHKHDFFMVLFITQGTGTHTIDFNSYPALPNTVFFLSPGQVHSWELSEDADGYIIFFTPAYYLLSHPHKKLYNFPFFNALLSKPLLTPNESKSNTILQLYKQMEQEHTHSQLQKDDVIRDYLDILLILLTRDYQAQAKAEPGAAKGLNLLQQLEHLIDQHYKQHHPVSFYAGQMHMTVKQLNDTCKRTVGHTTSELIQQRVLLEAKRLLVHSHLTVSQIAAELGYFDNSYFSRFFKKHVGQSPERFRQSAG